MINIYQTTGDTCRIVSRNEKKERIIQDIKLKPYFYVADVNGEYVSIYGDRAKKVETKNSMDIIKQRDNYSKTFESDVLFTNRVLIDKVPDFGNPDLRIMYFDIENNVEVYMDFYHIVHHLDAY